MLVRTLAVEDNSAEDYLGVTRRLYLLIDLTASLYNYLYLRKESNNYPIKLYL